MWTAAFSYSCGAARCSWKITQIRTMASTNGGIQIIASSPLNQSAMVTVRHAAPVGFMHMPDKSAANIGGTETSSATAT